MPMLTSLAWKPGGGGGKIVGGTPRGALAKADGGANSEDEIASMEGHSETVGRDCMLPCVSDRTCVLAALSLVRDIVGVWGASKAQNGDVLEDLE